MMRQGMRWAVVPAVLAGLVGCGDAQPCDGVTGSCTSITVGMPEADMVKAFVSAPSNSTIVFEEGTFVFSNSLNLASAPGITVRGAGIDKTVIDFQYQSAGADGIVQNNPASGGGAVTFQDFTVKDTYGNGVKVVGAVGVTIRRVKALWTGAVRGPYGLYPVSCKNVLIEDSVVDGARDAGLYVGQSDTIIVRNNVSMNNVAGIEIENSFNADVYGNTVTHNTGGILVFDLPGLQQLGGHNVRVFNNTIKDNNTSNFGIGGTVSIVPAGTGVVVMANQNVEIYGNTITGNGTVGTAVISYYVTQLPITDPGYTPIPARVYIHDNTYSGNGTHPDPDKDLGLLLLSAGDAWPNGAISDVVYDGIIAPGATNDQVQICVQRNGSGGMANLHFDQLPAHGFALAETLTFDAAPYDCSLPALPAVTVPNT
jgi:parallel beta-helix repeat protein